MTPRRVLFLINDLGMGGAQRVVFHQATTLAPERYRAEVASFEFDSSGTLVGEFTHAGIPVHRLRRPDEPVAVAWPRVNALIRRLAPDVVHTHLAAAGVLGRVAARRANVPCVVTTLHNLSDWEEKRSGPLRWLDRRTLGLADSVVSVSEAVRRAVVAALPALADRAVTVHNGVPVHQFAGARGDRAASRTELGLDAADFVVGSVARLDPRKGLDVLIEAVARAAERVPRLRVVVAGDGPERARLETLVESLGLVPRVHLLPHRIGVRSLLGALDLFVAPSRTEGLGVAIIEALAAGLPVLGSSVGGIPEVIEDGACGRLLPHSRPDAWAEALVAAAANPEVVRRWAEAAPRRAARFSLEVAAERMQALYDGLLDARDDAESMREAA